MALLAGCQTTGAQPGQVEYSIFFSPTSHIEELLEANDLEGASAVYEDQDEYFLQKEKESRRRVAATLAAKLADQLKSIAEAAKQELHAIEWPTDQRHWPMVRNALEKARQVTEMAAQHEILSEPEFRPAWLNTLEEAAADLEEKARDSADQMFASYPLSISQSFFDAYPVELEAERFLATKRWGNRLDGLDASALIHFNRTYGDVLPEWVKLDLGRRYYQSLLDSSARDAAPEFQRVLRSIERTRKAGFDLHELPGPNVTVAQTWDDASSEVPRTEPNVRVDLDLPFSAFAIADSDALHALDDPRGQAADILVLVNVAAVSQDQALLEQETVQSEYQSGTRVEPNPNYAAAQARVNQATVNYQAAAAHKITVDSEYCYGWGCIGKAVGQIAAGAALGNARDALEAATAELARTSAMVEKPVYSPYSFRKVKIRASRKAVLHYYVLERENRKYAKDSFLVERSKNFLVAYGLHEKDRYRYTHQKGISKEDKIVAFQTAEIEAKLSDVLDSFLSATAESKPLLSYTALRQEIVADAMTAKAVYGTREYKVSAKKDERFESVVVVHTLSGSGGTGFFVDNDVVLTNYHVIEGNKFIDIKMSNGEETFGKVMAFDVRRDLALIKVQGRGKSVVFYNDLELPLGRTIEAIGHPGGSAETGLLEFTLTRGIVSGVRDVETMKGGKKVKFIQTDAAMNPGNSGGPLFLQGKVIGVNSWGQKWGLGERLPVPIEGLNFAVHYAEVLDFLAQHQIHGSGS